MLSRLEWLKDVLRTPLFWKIAVILFGYFFALVNQVVEPAELRIL